MSHSSLSTIPALILLCASETLSSPADAEFISLRCMIGQEKYDEAMTTCIEMIRAHPDRFPLYETLPEVAQYAGNLDKAIDFLDSRVEDGTSLPFVYYGLGMAYYSKHDYRAAVIYFSNAIEASNTTPECYRGLEYAYEKLEGLDAATRYFNLLCHRDPENSNNWYGLALAYWSRQDYQRVKSCLLEALARRPGERRYVQAQAAAAYLRGETDAVAGMMNNLIENASEDLDFVGKEFLKSFLVIGHFNRDRYQSAIQTIQEIINDSKTYGLLRWLGWGYKRMSDVKFLMGEYQPAISYAKQAAAVAVKGGDEELLLASLSRQFEVYSEIGDYYDALETAYSKQTVAQKSGMDREETRVLGDIAWTLHSLGSDDIALEYAIEALGRSDAFTADLRLQYPLQTIVGQIYEGRGEYSEALKHFSNAAALIPKDKMYRRSMAVSHGQLGRTYLKLKKYAESKQHLMIQLRLAQIESYESEVVSAETYLGMLYLAQGSLARAREILNKSFGAAIHLDMRPALRTSARGLSILAEKASQLEDAVRWREKAIAATESMGLCPERLMSIAGRNHELLSDYHEYVRLLCMLGRADLAFAAAERARSISLAKFVSLTQLEKTVGVSDLRKARLQRIQRDILQIHSKIACEEHPIVPQNTNESTLRLFSSLSRLELSFQRALDTLLEEDRPLISSRNVAAYSLQDIQRLYLSPKQCLIEYVVGENSTAVIVVSRDTICAFTIDVTQCALEQLLSRISRVYSECRKGYAVMNAAVADFDIERLHEAYELIFRRPLLASGHANRVTIIRDGTLSNLPFEILVTGWSSGTDSCSHKGPQFAVEQYEINYALSVWNDLLIRSHTRSAPKLILAIGDPVVIEKSQGGRAVLPWSPRHDDAPMHSRGYPGVRRELSAIRSIFGSTSTVLSKSGATVTNFSVEASQYRILHLAGHVNFDESRPLYSLIPMTNTDCNERLEGLRAIDFLSLDLNADLVVLSGCNTGRFSRQSGLDGMTSSIMISGVPSVIASLWNVDDEVTASLMEAFYRYLKQGNTRGESLRNAKIDMIKAGRTDPFYWGAFVLIGDGGSLPLHDMESKPIHNTAAQIVVLIVLTVFWIACFLAMVDRRHERSHTSSRAAC